MQIFARIKGTNKVAQFDQDHQIFKDHDKKWEEYETKVNSTPIPARFDIPMPVVTCCPLPALQFIETQEDYSSLPEVTEEQAKSIVENSHHSGAYMDVATLVLVKLGEEKMQEYCECQSYAGMRKDFLEASDEDRKWWFSGLEKPEAK